MENSLVPWSASIRNQEFDIKEVIILNEFTSQTVELKYFKIDTINGKLTFNTPFGYFHRFMQHTTMNSMADKCMEDANYDVHILFLIGEQKGTIIIERPILLACNNYGTEEGHQILLQATEKELKITKGWKRGHLNRECSVQQPVTDTDRELLDRHQEKLGDRTGERRLLG